MSPAPRRAGLKLRTKLFALFPLLLSIPYVGYEYVRETEEVLRRGLEESVLATARALALSLHDKPSLFAAQPGLGTTDAAEIIYAHPLTNPIELDGYTSDWGQHRTQLKALPLLEDGDAQASYVAGSRDGYLYILFSVVDESVIYRDPQNPLSLNADQLNVALRDRQGKLRRYLINALSPGRATTFEIPARRTTVPTRIEVRVRAQWQPNANGYVLELRLPLSMLGTQLGFRVLDVDSRISNAELDPLGAASVHVTRYPLVLPSARIGALIDRLGQFEGRRVWVVDRWRRVLARAGTLERSGPAPEINPFYGLLLRPPSDEIFEDSPVVSHLEGPDVTSALAGNPLARWRATSENNLWVVSTGFPISDGVDVVGAVIVEESSLGIQTLTRTALANLLNKTLMVCFVGALALVLFAGRIVTRLRRLSRETDSAIDEHGRVVGQLGLHHGRDEIGELADSFDNMMLRLREYNSYLENLARRLSHELRTPLAIVRSSVESLQMQASDEATKTYTHRATEGLSRLDSLITRMSEAARLEQAIESSELARFDLGVLTEEVVKAYRETWPEHSFQLDVGASPAVVNGVPDLVVEMLDKLVSNARELGDAKRPITVTVSRQSVSISLTVTNYGSTLPASMQGKLFESMVSIRNDSDSAAVHLGLGLYIARLIADFHGATIRASNLDSGDGVAVVIAFKTA